MAIGVDSTNWKPRKIKGTPAARHRNFLAVGLVGFGIFIGAFYQFSGITAKFRKAFDKVYEDPIEEVERKQIIASGLPARSGDHIRKIMKDYEQPDKPHIEANNSLEVVSEYFAHPVMDQSSSKKNEAQSTLKNSQAKLDKVQKKPRNRVKGQKDIRTLIKPKKNELVTYSKDFDVICKQLGVDVDPEQLQLAIALSRSLQDSDPVPNEAATKKALTSNQRKGKIRTTLQEYGFKVPEFKNIKTKRVKKYRTNYPLLLTTDTEKQGKIADKYSQILFTNIANCSLNEVDDLKCENFDSYLFYLSTNVTYEHLKDDEIFYVNNLVEKPLNVKNHMLRDWSEIPGRPKSPVCEVPDLSFKSIKYSEKELSIILSGTVEAAQQIVRNSFVSKSAELKESKSDQELESSITGEQTEISLGNSEKTVSKDNLIDHKSTKDYSVVDFRNNYCTTTMTPPTNRSCSPDIFDDEVTIIMDSSKDIITIQDVAERTRVREPNDFMDLTECVVVMNCNATNVKQNSCLSQGSNKTRMDPNDFMEMTECVSACSQKNNNNILKTNNFEKKNCNPNGCNENTEVETMDLTQTPNSGNNSQSIQNDDKGNKSSNDTIILVEDYCNINMNNGSLKVSSIIDLVAEPNILNTSDMRDSVMHLTPSPQREENEIYLVHEKNNSPNKGSLTDIPNTSPGNSHLINDNKNDDAMDLTQSSNSENDLSPVQMHDLAQNSYHSNTSMSIAEISKDAKTSYQTHNQQTSPVYYLQNDTGNYGDLSPVKTPSTKKGPSSPQSFIGDYDHFGYDSPIYYDIPSRGSDNNESNNVSPQKHRTDEAMDLTQSSNSEESLLIVEEAGGGRKSLDDTIIVNDHPNSVENDREIKEKIETEKNLHNKSLLTVNEHLHSINANVLNNKQSTSQTSDISGDDGSLKNGNSFIYENDYIFDNDNDIETYMFDVSQRSNSSDDQNIDPNIQGTYGKQRHEKEKSIINDISTVTVTQCLNIIREDGQSFENSNADREFDDIIKNNSHNKQSDSYISKVNDVTSPNFNNDISEKDVDIDLTQNSGGSEDKMSTPEIVEVPYELGKQNNISIDYDEICTNTENNRLSDLTFDVPTCSFFETEKNNSVGEAVSGSSQKSAVFEISDNEFNYSVNQGKQDNESIRLDQTKFDIGGVSAIDEFLNRNSLSRSKLRCSCSSNSDTYSDKNKDNNCQPEVEVINNVDILGSKVHRQSKSCTEMDCIKVSTPTKFRSNENLLLAQTPKHNDYIIKTDVTPMPNYDSMTSPERNEELDKFGIKPLKRKRAIQILTHIYNQTHPVMAVISEIEDYSSPSKIRKRNGHTSIPRRALCSQIDLLSSNDYVEPGPSLMSELSQKSQKSCKKLSKNTSKSPLKSPIISSNECNLYMETKQLPDIRNIECSPEDWVFQKREKAKVHSCRVPLHIAFHNYVSCRRGLRGAILRYEPINIDDIHKGLVAIGYRYNPKDLLKFIDKKCITVKTADNARNNKK